jgi:molybdopterin converting factor small subunit
VSVSSKKIRIFLKLFASLRLDRFDTANREYDPGTSVAGVIRIEGLPEKDVTLMLVNGRHVEFDHILADGDTLSLFPPLGGG